MLSVRGRGLATKSTVPTTLFLPILWDPNANHSITTMGGWAGQVPEGRDSTPMPSRKKEREIHIYWLKVPYIDFVTFGEGAGGRLVLCPRDRTPHLSEKVP